MLYGLGVPATLQTTFNTTYERDYYSVIVNPSAVHRFLEVVGFRLHGAHSGRGQLPIVVA